MTLTIHDDLVQRSDEWYAARRGLVTASAVGQLISQRSLTAIDFQCPNCWAAPDDPCLGKAGAPIKTMHPVRAEAARSSNAPPVVEAARNDYSRSLTLVLAAERITGWTEVGYVSDDMWRGIEDEPFARDKYSEHFAPVTEAGFMVENKWGFSIGYSPDGLVGNDGLIEVKSRRPKSHLKTILAGRPPIQNMAQLQCALLVSGREWIDYVSYCGGMPLWVKRVEPQREWIDAILEATSILEDTLAGIVRTYTESVAGLPMTERTLAQEMVI